MVGGSPLTPVEGIGVSERRNLEGEPARILRLTSINSPDAIIVRIDVMRMRIREPLPVSDSSATIEANASARLAAQARLVSALRDAAMAGAKDRRVELIETHISYVILTGQFAYKIKKALELGFLDFRSLAARRFYCEEELRLNRRLAPKLYLEVVPSRAASRIPSWKAPAPPSNTR